MPFTRKSVLELAYHKLQLMHLNSHPYLDHLDIRCPETSQRAAAAAHQAFPNVVVLQNPDEFFNGDSAMVDIMVRISVIQVDVVFDGTRDRASRSITTCLLGVSRGNRHWLQFVPSKH